MHLGLYVRAICTGQLLQRNLNQMQIFHLNSKRSPDTRASNLIEFRVSIGIINGLFIGESERLQLYAVCSLWTTLFIGWIYIFCVINKAIAFFPIPNLLNHVYPWKYYHSRHRAKENKTEWESETLKSERAIVWVFYSVCYSFPCIRFLGF